MEILHLQSVYTDAILSKRKWITSVSWDNANKESQEVTDEMETHKCENDVPKILFIKFYD